ncbi:hypothetical protein [Massilia sp. CF038]|uniref:hypothetical protein n=1 Tax=Massilia sp. CF038 TaxID=1881045 RepID=UPI00091C5AF0|nr:hypothetical protein [Massilia sp. CF038]SHH71194.1 hypothetical protein SAMN05428948_5047 [Massilia sp. CF038]
MKTTLSPTLLRLLGAAFLATASAACSGVPGSAPAAPAAATTPAPVVAVATPAPAAPGAASAAAPAAAGLLQQLEAEIGAAACDTSAQCKTIAVGHKACGGPESYLAYSTKTGDAAKVARLAADYSAERKNKNAKSGMMSTCSVVVDPGASCNAGRCVPAGGPNLAR